jgi:hypothetical protein
MSNCNSVRSRLASLVTMSERDWPHEVGRHVGGCDACARAIAAERVARGVVVVATRGLEPGPAFANAVMAGIDSTDLAPLRDVWRPARLLLPAFGAVAAVVVVAFLQSGGATMPLGEALWFSPSAADHLVSADGLDMDSVLAAVLEDG